MAQFPTGKFLHGETHGGWTGWVTTIKIRDVGHISVRAASQKESIRAALHQTCLAMDCPHVFAVQAKNRDKRCMKCGLWKKDDQTSV